MAAQVQASCWPAHASTLPQQPHRARPRAGDRRSTGGDGGRGPSKGLLQYLLHKVRMLVVYGMYVTLLYGVFVTAKSLAATTLHGVASAAGFVTSTAAAVRGGDASSGGASSGNGITTSAAAADGASTSGAATVGGSVTAGHSLGGAAPPGAAAASRAGAMDWAMDHQPAAAGTAHATAASSASAAAEAAIGAADPAASSSQRPPGEQPNPFQARWQKHPSPPPQQQQLGVSGAAAATSAQPGAGAAAASAGADADPQPGPAAQPSVGDPQPGPAGQPQPAAAPSGRPPMEQGNPFAARQQREQQAVASDFVSLVMPIWALVMGSLFVFNKMGSAST
jgi:hypothetical protein